MPQVTPKDIISAVAAGLADLLELDKSLVVPAVQRFREPPTWLADRPFILIVAGAEQPDGGGHGAQDDAGTELHRVFFSVVVYYRNKLDRLRQSQQLLVADTALLDWCEKVKAALANTYLGAVPDAGYASLSTERIRWEGASPTEWESPDDGIVRRELTYSASYRFAIPDTMSMTNLNF